MLGVDHCYSERQYVENSLNVPCVAMKVSNYSRIVSEKLSALNTHRLKGTMFFHRRLIDKKAINVGLQSK